MGDILLLFFITVFLFCSIIIGMKMKELEDERGQLFYNGIATGLGISDALIIFKLLIILLRG